LVFVDHRIELPPDRIWKLYYQVVHDPSVWKGVFQQYDVGAAILSTDKQAGLVEQLTEAEGWEAVRTTESWVCFLQRGDE